MICPLGRDMKAPCPRKEPNGCFGCSEDLAERAAILEHGQGTGADLDPDFRPPQVERPTCRTRKEAEALAVEQARAAMLGQKSLTPDSI